MNLGRRVIGREGGSGSMRVLLASLLLSLAESRRVARCRAFYCNGIANSWRGQMKYLGAHETRDVIAVIENIAGQSTNLGWRFERQPRRPPPQPGKRQYRARRLHGHHARPAYR